MGALWNSFVIVICTFFVLFIVFPTLLYLFPQEILRIFLFMNYVKWPYTNYIYPQNLGVNYTSRNFYLSVDKNVKVGVWQILPKSLSDVSVQNDIDYEKILSEPKHPIVVYLHGRTGARYAPHRIHLYNILAANDYHVLALDYRGYGDSTGSPSELGVVEDSVMLYKWAKERAGSNHMFIWGHSLGAAIKHVNCPILMMHAKDDQVIPFELGMKLKKAAVNGGRDVTFVEFQSKFNYGHQYICNAPELPDVINKFFQKCLEIQHPPQMTDEIFN